VRSELEKGKNPAVVEVEGELVNKGFNVNKASVPYRFAIGKECADFLRQMIQHRRDAGEPIDNDTWLFRNHSQRLKVGLRRISARERGSPLKHELISDMVKKAATRAGIQVKRDIGKMVHAPVLEALPQETRVKYDTKSPREKVQFLKSIPAQMKSDTSRSKPKKGQRMIIDASEIGNHCNHGWRAVFQFQDGRVQVEYDGEDERE
jgi:hypothetical protein